MDGHFPMLIFGVIFLILAFFGAIALSGAQTGSCYTSGLGSAIRSSTGGEEDGNPNPTAEVLAEFFIFILLAAGVAMVTYVMVVKKKAGQLLDAGQTKAALIVNGNKKLDKEDIDAAQKDQLMHSLKDLGLPNNVITAGLQALKNGANSTMSAMSSKKSKKSGKNKTPKTSDPDSDSQESGDEDGDSN